MDRDLLLYRPRAAGGRWEVDELAVELGVRTGPQRLHGGDVLIVSGTAPLPWHAQRVELFAHPTDADAELNPPTRQPIQRGDLLRQHERVALRHDQDARAEAQRRRRRGDKRQPDQRVGNRGIGQSRDLSVNRVRVLRIDGGRKDHVLAAPHRVEAERLGLAAEFEGVVPFDADTAGKGKSEFHVATVSRGWNASQSLPRALLRPAGLHYGIDSDTMTTCTPTALSSPLAIDRV